MKIRQYLPELLKK